MKDGTAIAIGVGVVVVALVLTRRASAAAAVDQCAELAKLDPRAAAICRAASGILGGTKVGRGAVAAVTSLPGSVGSFFGGGSDKPFTQGILETLCKQGNQSACQKLADFVGYRDQRTPR